MAEKKKWLRPQDVKYIRTSDPNKMVGKWLQKSVLKTWSEDFADEATGDVITIRRQEVLMRPGQITKEKAAQLQFFIAAGDIEDVEVCDQPIRDMTLYVPSYLHLYNVELHYGIEEKALYLVFAQHISQAITIAAEFGQMYRNMSGLTLATRVSVVDARIVPDDHPCIPEDARKPAEEVKAYFKVMVRTTWLEAQSLKKRDCYYIVTANEVGEAKDRISRLLDIMQAEAAARGEVRHESWRQTVRKAVPLDVDCVVPKEFSELYHQEPTQ